MERDDNGQFVAPYKGGRMDGWGRGMDNRRANFDIPADVLRLVVNADMLASGRVRRRRGIAQKIASPGAHSVFGSTKRLFWATQTALKACDTNFTMSTIASSVKYADPLSFVELHGDVYYSNEQINGKVNSNGVHSAWGIVPPLTAPTVVCLDDLTSVAVKRHYQVTCTFVVKIAGIEVEESGAPIGTKIQGSDAGVLSLSNIPVSTDSRVTHTRIYVTDVDGTVFFSQVDLPTGMNVYMVSRPFAVGKKLSSQLLTNMPAGQLVEYYNGRMYVAVGNILYYSEPLRYGSQDAAHGFVMFPERITLLKAVNDGLYLSSDGTYFLSGTPEKDKLSLIPIVPYKAVEGTACNVPNTHNVMWLADRGIMVGANGGKVKNVTEDRIAMDTATRGCMGIVETNGSRRAVVIMRESTPSPYVSSDFMDAEADRVKD